MAKPLVFQLGESTLAFDMNKVDRGRLYGSKEIRAVDGAGNSCELATLAGDGCTLVVRGGTGLGWLDTDGCWRDKSELMPVDKDGNPIEAVRSSFDSAIKLFDTATVEQYLDHNVRLVYALAFEPSSSSDSVDELMTQLKRGTIFQFLYSYRGGLEADTAFLLTNESGELMMAIGSPTQVEYIGMAAVAATVEDSGDADDDVDLMDFDMI